MNTSSKGKISLIIVAVLVLAGGGIFLFRTKIADYALDRVQKEMYLNNVSAAEKYLTMAKFLDKSSSRYHYLAGNVNLLMKRYEEAVSHFNAALDSGFTPAEWILVKRAAVYEFSLANPEKALADYAELKKINPNNPFFDERSADIHYRIGDFNAALNALRGAVNLREKSNSYQDNAGWLAQDYSFMGRIYFLNASYKDAIQLFQKSIEALSEVDNPALQNDAYEGKIAVMTRLAMALSKDGDAQGALAEINKILETEPNHAWVWCGLAGIRNDAGEYEKAVEAADKGLSLAENHDECIYNLGMAYYKLNKSTEAKFNLQKYLELTNSLVNDPRYKIYRASAQDLLARIK